MHTQLNIEKFVLNGTTDEVEIDGENKTVTCNGCPNGKQYVLDECTKPTRTTWQEIPPYSPCAEESVLQEEIMKSGRPTTVPINRITQDI